MQLAMMVSRWEYSTRPFGNSLQNIEHSSVGEQPANNIHNNLSLIPYVQSTRPFGNSLNTTN